MRWPDQPLERTPPHEFQPPYCPRPGCASHRQSQAETFRWHRHGVFVRASDRRVVPRFRCLGCRRTFSLQTFAFSYYLKRPALAPPIAAGLQAGSAHRQLARSLHCAPSSVTRLSARLGRHALLLLALSIERLSAIREPVVYDAFETFAFSQDTPFGMGTAVGRYSWFIYGLEHAPHRRSGRRSPAQKSRGAVESPAARPGAYRRALGHVLELLHDKVPHGQPLRLITDDHPAYRACMARHPCRGAFAHDIHPNPRRPFKGAPRSPKARLRDREMFATDLLHGLMRHSLAHHRRETIAFGRRLNALMERGFLMAAWRNFVKGRSERRPDPTTPAMRLGLATTPWGWDRLLARRLFPSRLRVPTPWMRIYRREIITPQVGPNARHQCRLAF